MLRQPNTQVLSNRTLGKEEKVMKLIIIPPYRAQNYTPERGHFMVREIVEDMKQKGQLEGVEVDLDPGHPIEHTTDTTGKQEDHVMAYRAFDEISAGTLKRVRMFCEGDKYDASVTSGGIDPGFIAARMASKVPVAAALNSAVHKVILIGDRRLYISTTRQRYLLDGPSRSTVSAINWSV
jgi:hypothetical protein